MPPENISANATIIENIWIQYSALGVLFAVLLTAVILLYRIIRNKDKNHKEEWEKLRIEQRTDRDISEKRHDERMKSFLKAIKEITDKFASVTEGALNKNSDLLVENKVVLSNCKK